MTEAPLVCVTGGSGHIGSWVVKEALDRGWRVRATVRDPSDDKATAHLRALGPVELFAADLLKPGSFDLAIAGCDGVFHVAAVVAQVSKDPQAAIVDPAVKGTDNVLSSVDKAGTVRRVVMTSSVVACGDHKAEGTITEDHWNEACTVQTDPYAVAKTHSERLARQRSEGAAWDIVTIHPGYVLGPLLNRKHRKASAFLVGDLASAAMPACPPLYLGFVDVRDAAAAHCEAFLRPEAHGRYILVSDYAWARDIARLVAASHPEWKVPTGQLPMVAMYLGALFDKRLSLNLVRNVMGRTIAYDGARAVGELGTEYIGLSQMVADTLESLQAFGCVRPKTR